MKNVPVLHLIASSLCAILLASNSHAEIPFDRIEVEPTQLTLAGERATAQILVTGYTPNNTPIDLTQHAVFSPTPLVEIESGYVKPQQDGSVVIDVRYRHHRTPLNITITGSTDPTPISFRWETLAVLTKQGCNGGACHGKPNGRGALELSLNAFDPKLDQENLVRGSWVRFTTPLVPEQSLILKKPTLAIPHGGGKRLRKGTEPYEILRRWVEEGCQVDNETAPDCVAVQVEPKSRVLPIHDDGGRQQMQVIASFSDGSSRDVTRIASYTLSDPSVGDVTPTGVVLANQRGQTAVVVRYLDRVVAAKLTLIRDIPGFEWNPPNETNYVDQLVNNKLRQLQYQPANTCDDATFLRRVSLDIRGLLPTVAEARTFLSDKNPHKRSTLIDRWLESPEYASHWSLRMADLLRINRESLSKDRATAYSSWVADSIADNMPYDRFVRELLTASGTTSEVPAANFYRVAPETKQVSESVAQIFMGSRIMCAQCHNHPYESWTQDNYYQIASAFHEVDRSVDDPKKKLPAPDNEVTVGLTTGRRLSNPRTGIEQKPWPTELERQENEDSRIAFANWLTSSDNPYFARVAVNRIWSQLMGRGIVEPIDDFRSSNPAANDQLLDALAADFINAGFDRKHIIRKILNSQTYQRKSETTPFNKSDETLFSHARIRLLSAEAIQDAIRRLCEGATAWEQLTAKVNAIETSLPKDDSDASSELRTELNKAKQKRAGYFMTQQPYPHLTTFLKAFGQPERKTACACERRDEVSLDQALQLMNSPLIRQQVNHARQRFGQMSDQELTDQLYLSAFSRFPKPQEVQAILDHLEATHDREQAIEDIVWALINTNEFLFQH
ncbi:MAG: DUF1549 and DUF1553 domain-containing protein [Pirellulaceae bacterium]|nr:DUF1549 and DUF1553 domain-containing protein [Pirellulaceae bacterium]